MREPLVAGETAMQARPYAAMRECEDQETSCITEILE